MKALLIRWQRLFDETNQTCDRTVTVDGEKGLTVGRAFRHDAAIHGPVRETGMIPNAVFDAGAEGWR